MKNLNVPEALEPDDFDLPQAVAEIRRNEQLELAKQRNENKLKIHQNLMSRAAIPFRYQNASLNNCLAGQVEAYAKARFFTDNFEKNIKSGAGYGLLFFGDIGTGKTHLACAIANELMKQYKPVLYTTVLEAILLVKKPWSNSEISEFETYEQLAKPELLIIDEIGVQKGSDFEINVISSIIDTRSRACLPTIAISNLNPIGVAEMIGERAFDRLLGCGGDIVQMVGKSLRTYSYQNIKGVRHEQKN